MARMGHMRGWSAVRLAMRAKTHFYADLADVIEKWQREGFSVVVGWDLNDDWAGDAGAKLRDWAQRLGLVNAHEFLQERGRARGEAATFVGSDGREGRRRCYYSARWSAGHLAHAQTSRAVGSPSTDPFQLYPGHTTGV